MVERSVEVGDLSGDFSEVFLVCSAAAEDANKLRRAIVVARVLATKAHVLAVTHERHVVGLLVQPFPVEEVSRESAFMLVLRPVRRTCLHVKAELLALAHAVNEGLADEVADVLSRLAAEGLLDNLGAKSGKLALVLHESADRALLVPDEEVLVGSSSIVDSRIELL